VFSWEDLRTAKTPRHIAGSILQTAVICFWRFRITAAVQQQQQISIACA
jgi:hypothetical protein